MFTLRPDQVALLAKNFNAGELLEAFGKLGFTPVWEEGSDEIKLVDPRGYTTGIELDEQGRIVGTLSPLGQSQQFAYDARNRLVGYQSPSGSVLHWTHDEEDRPNSLTVNQTQRWVLESDEPSNLTAIAYPDGSFCRMEYQGWGSFVAYKDRADVVTHFERDAIARLAGIVHADGAGTQCTYSKWDKPDCIAYPNGTREEHTRDTKGRLTAVTVNGEPWAKVAWDNVRRSQRIQRIDYADDHFVEFKYNSSGQVIEANNPNSTVTRQYDENGRLLEENQDGHIVRFTYDAAGLLTAITNPQGEAVGFSYDADGRLIALEDWSGKKHTVEYEQGGRVIRQRLASGAVTEIRSGVLDRPESITTESPQGFSMGLRYQWNINGQVARLDDSELGYKLYQYDREGQATRVMHERGDIEQYAYDARRNRIANGTVAGSYDAANQILTHGADQLAHDARGNVTQVVGVKGKTQYGHNGQNLLLVADLPGYRRVEYRYDAFGRRISKLVDGYVYTRYIWAGEQLLGEITEEGNKKTSCDYLFLPGTHIPFALRRDGRICYYHNDALGTPRWLTDELGWVVWSADYLSFGTARLRNNRVPQPLRFPGHYYDEETGLHYNRARYYSPELGRYLSRDPLDLTSGLNFYAYANNDPVNEADPLGLLSGWAKVALGIGIAAIGAAVVVVAAPAIIAVAAGAAITAATAGAAAAVMAGGAAIGAGIALALSPDGCWQCQARNMIRGASAGIMAALAMLTLPFSGPAAGAFALAGGGTMAASSMTAAVLSINVIGASAVAGTVSMMSSIGEGGGSGEQSTRDVTNDEASASKARTQARIEKMKEKMTEGDKKYTTYATAEVENPEGETEVWVSNAGKQSDVPPSIREAAGGDESVTVIQDQELPDAARGSHLNDAEQKIYRQLDELNSSIPEGQPRYTLKSIGATRDMCDVCRDTTIDNFGNTDSVATPIKNPPPPSN